MQRHDLSDAPSGPGKGADLDALIQRLGFVQLDSINTVARAHDLILFARRPAYRSKHLKRLHDVDRALFGAANGSRGTNWPCPSRVFTSFS